MKPFLKWAGGKSRLLKQYRDYFPNEINNYFEPFIGGGAVFFELKGTGKIKEHAAISDTNEELINAYLAVRDDVHCLINELQILKAKHSKENYYQVRDWGKVINSLSDVQRAARTIYLNKTCYNGLYRVNSEGGFNVPLGRYDNPQIFSEEELLAASSLLQGVDISTCDYSRIAPLVKPEDFVYFDPPYYPISGTANFTAYTSNGFSTDEQVRLRDFYKALDSKGVLCMLSNSDTPFIRSLYENYKIIEVFANRAINSKATNRKKILELAIINYCPETG